MAGIVNGKTDPSKIAWTDLSGRERKVLATIAQFDETDRYAYGAEIRREIWPEQDHSSSVIYNVLGRLEGVGLVHDDNSADHNIKDYGLTDAGQRLLDSADQSPAEIAGGEI